ncbi:MAG: DUF167 domain-containing protein [Alphaproteobacteria bacterium]|nr:DUF167 domain-containing protein [Alphaproteobacteria bacterium]
MTGSPIRCVADGATAAIRLTPKAKKNRVTGTVCQADGSSALKVEVTAAPERGKANAALIALLAKAWRLPKSAFTLTMGTTNRWKTIHIAGDPDTLKQTLDEWVAEHDG